MISWWPSIESLDESRGVTFRCVWGVRSLFKIVSRVAKAVYAFFLYKLFFPTF